MTIQATNGGDWLPAEQLRRALAEWLGQSGEATVNLGGVDYLDAGVLQVLLALAAEQRSRGADLRLVHASSSLRQWFGYAGAAQYFFFA